MRPCVRKVEFGKVTHRRCEINKRHKSAQYFYKTSHVRLCKEDSDTWTIESLTDNGKQYTIQRLNVECSCALTSFTCTHVLALMSLYTVQSVTVHLLSMCDTDSKWKTNKSGTGQHTSRRSLLVNFSTQRYFSNEMWPIKIQVHMLSKK